MLMDPNFLFRGFEKSINLWISNIILRKYYIIYRYKKLVPYYRPYSTFEFLGFKFTLLAQHERNEKKLK